MLSCSYCKRKAEFYLDVAPKKKLYFCEDHGIKYLAKSKESLLPRIKH